MFVSKSITSFFWPHFKALPMSQNHNKVVKVGLESGSWIDFPSIDVFDVVGERCASGALGAEVARGRPGRPRRGRAGPLRRQGGLRSRQVSQCM